jgi:hypothetical protein
MKRSVHDGTQTFQGEEWSEGRLPELLSEFWPRVWLRGRLLVEAFDGG